MKKYHGSRNQYSYQDKEEYISPKEMLDRVSDENFIDIVNEIVSNHWLETYKTNWLVSLRKEINNQRTGFIPERKKKGFVRSLLKWCEGRDIAYGVGLHEGKYFRDVASDIAGNLLEFPFGKLDDFDEILNEHSSKFQKKADMGGFNKNTTPFLTENKELLLLAYQEILPKVEEAIVFTEYDSKRVIRAERIGFSNTAAHAQLTRTFQDSVVAFSNQRTLDEIIERASDGKIRIAKMMKRDLGFQSESLASNIKAEHQKIKQTKNIMLFNRCMDDVL